MIPKGFRKIGDEETLSKEHLRYSIGMTAGLPLKPDWIGFTRAQLLKSGKIGEGRIFLAKLEGPEFEGWEPIGVNKPTQEGDVVVIIKPTPKQLSDGKALTPETGKPVPYFIFGDSLKEAYPEDRNIKAGRLCVYRKITTIKARRFPPGAYADPLPLP